MKFDTVGSAVCSPYFSHFMNKRLIQFINDIGTVQTALDLGAGTGVDVANLNTLGIKAEGVDLKTGVDLEQPYLSPNAPFDFVYSCFVIHKLKNRCVLVSTMKQNVKRGGYVLIHTFDVSDPLSTSDLSEYTLRTLLGAFGFVDILTRTFEVWDDEEGHNHYHTILEATARVDSD
jgi:ubiquinone/menaquinone biosynthesis C-methylase UbiE